MDKKVDRNVGRILKTVDYFSFFFVTAYVGKNAKSR